jgi:hypothetical protein
MNSGRPFEPRRPVREPQRAHPAASGAAHRPAGRWASCSRDRWTATCAYSTKDGAIVWDFDTTTEFTTVNGAKARGGSIDVGGPAIANGHVLTTPGYGQWGGLSGNVLLAFSVDGSRPFQPAPNATTKARRYDLLRVFVSSWPMSGVQSSETGHKRRSTWRPAESGKEPHDRM